MTKHAGAADPEVALDPLAPYLLIFTSGTTGQPKAALCSQQRLAFIGWNICTNRGVRAGRRLLPGDAALPFERS